MLVPSGFSNLVNMEGGYHGAMDMLGRVVEPGWLACGFESSREAQADRTWEALKK